MANYIKKPEPMRFQTPPVVERAVEKTKAVEPLALDINALANAVAHAITLNLPRHTQSSDAQYAKDTFDNSQTMNRLADQMLVQRGDSKANFDDLVNVIKTKKDQKDVDETIDWLKNLND